MEIHQLIKKGFSKKKVAEKLGISRSTVHRYLNQNHQCELVVCSAAKSLSYRPRP
ncbi:helix-turn-helix domain-containing protein [Niallia sp. FSL W8-1348]|uniref:helix-turn-helix domain-containing protein n=1 Tax=Niallia sp. FSL W8-1348 TaxID=2954656 RepID=UPI00404072C1